MTGLHFFFNLIDDVPTNHYDDFHLQPIDNDNLIYSRDVFNSQQVRLAHHRCENKTGESVGSCHECFEFGNEWDICDIQLFG